MLSKLSWYDVYPSNEIKSINSIRLDYTTEGLRNKREIALTVPNIQPYNEYDTIHFGDAGEGRAVAWVRFGDAIGKRGLNDAEKSAIKENIGTIESWTKYDGKQFVAKRDLFVPSDASNHSTYIADYGEKGFVLEVNDKFNGVFKTKEDAVQAYVDIRIKEEESKGRPIRVLVIDEVQSKRHQDAKEKGYDNVPDAPFRDSWDALAMKRMLRLAAEEGYDKIAWTSGEMQSDRYDIGNSIESLYVDQRPGEPDRFVVARPVNGGELIEFSFDTEGKITKGSLGEDSLEGKTLSDVYGKDVSQMILLKFRK